MINLELICENFEICVKLCVKFCIKTEFFQLFAVWLCIFV